MTPNEPLLTAEEVATTLRLDGETIRRWAREGSLPSLKLPGGQWRFRWSDVEAYLRGDTKAEVYVLGGTEAAAS